MTHIQYVVKKYEYSLNEVWGYHRKAYKLSDKLLEELIKFRKFDPERDEFRNNAYNLGEQQRDDVLKLREFLSQIEYFTTGAHMAGDIIIQEKGDKMNVEKDLAVGANFYLNRACNWNDKAYEVSGKLRDALLKFQEFLSESDEFIKQVHPFREQLLDDVLKLREFMRQGEEELHEGRSLGWQLLKKMRQNECRKILSRKNQLPSKPSF